MVIFRSSLFKGAKLLGLNIGFDIEERKLAFRHEGLASEQTYLDYAQKMADVEPARKTERMLQIVRFATALAGAGFEVTVGPYETSYFTFNCTEKDLPAVYKAVGHVEVMCKDVENARRRLLNVYLTAKDYPDYCRIKYQKKLPVGALTDQGEAPKDGQKCRIVRKRVPAKTEFVLECST
jgi:hypothetical protein